MGGKAKSPPSAADDRHAFGGHVVDQRAHLGGLIAGGVVAHHQRAERVHHAVEDEFGPDRAHRIGNNLGCHAAFVEQLSRADERLRRCRAPGQARFCLRSGSRRSRLDIAAGIHRGAANDNRIRARSNTSAFPMPFCKRDQRRISGEHWAELRERGGSRFRFDEKDYCVKCFAFAVRRDDPLHRYAQYADVCR